MSKPNLSVVVCAYDEAERIEACIAALLDQDLAGAQFEVIVIDDGSRDGTLDLARRLLEERHEPGHPAFTLVQMPHGGLCRARNAGILRADAEIIAFTDADAAPDEDWARRIVERFDADPDLEVLGGRVRIINPESFVARFLDLVHYGVSDEREVIGCNMAFRRSYFRRWGGFHSGFHSRGDETELLMRSRGAAKTAKDLELWVEHERPESLREWLREREANGRYFAWGERLAQRTRLVDRLFPAGKRVLTASWPLWMIAGTLAPLAALVGGLGLLALWRRSLRGGRGAYLLRHAGGLSGPEFGIGRARLIFLGSLLNIAGDWRSDLGWLQGAFETPGPEASSCGLRLTPAQAEWRFVASRGEPRRLDEAREPFAAQGLSR
jgi:glycosyltransferase involved in cell wall biosynthesis